MANQTKVQRFFRLISFLSSGYPKTKDECITLLGIKDSAFYNYRNTLLESGFDVRQKDGQYWIDYPDQGYQALQNVLHFSEEECYLLGKYIDMLNENVDTANRLKHKLTVFFNQNKAIKSPLYNFEHIERRSMERTGSLKPIIKSYHNEI
ncbi:MAG: hypothetical protein AB2L20_25210 [Mangrovibacterium sp.]